MNHEHEKADLCYRSSLTFPRHALVHKYRGIQKCKMENLIDLFPYCYGKLRGSDQHVWSFQMASCPFSGIMQWYIAVQ